MSDRLVRSAPGKRADGPAARRQDVVRWDLSWQLLIEAAVKAGRFWPASWPPTEVASSEGSASV